MSLKTPSRMSHAVGARRDRAACEPCGHRRAAGGQPRSRLLGEIVEPHHHDCEARGRVGGDSGDRAGVQNGVRRLHHRPDPGSLGRAGLAQRPRGGHDRAGTVDLGQKDRVRPGGRGGGEILVAPGRMRPIDADDDLAAAEAALAHRLGHLSARRDLLVGGDRILEIENKRIGGQGRGLGQGLGVGAGHVEDASARASEHVDLLTFRPEFKGKPAAAPEGCSPKQHCS